MSGCLIQVVPEIPPDIGGVADYAELLKLALAGRGCETLFLAPRKVGRPPRKGVIEFEQSVMGFQSVLRKALESGPVTGILVHYVGYGYDPRGCPGWLVSGLEQLNPAPRITTIFHELQLSGPPWTIRFWLLPKQKDLIRRLSRMSSCGVVTSPGAQCDLGLIDPRSEPARVVAIPSNFGEPPRASWPAVRKSVAVVLGLPPVRGRVYQAGAAALEVFCRKAALTLIHDVGPNISQTPASIAGVPVKTHGILPAEAVSALLLECRVLITSYPARSAAKSTVIAAGMAHGCAIYNCTEAVGPNDGWSEWKPLGWSGAGWRDAGEAGFATYHRHRSWEVAAEKMSACLFETSNDVSQSCAENF